MKVIFAILLSIMTISSAKADSVHLGLKIHYETAMSHVEKEDLPIIGILVRLSELLPQSRLLVAGHTDNVGNYKMNIELSRGRAEILKYLLIKNGMPKDRIEAKWYSYDAPIDSNKTPLGRSKNRRVVATVYGVSADEAQKIVRAADKSDRFYVISVENKKVDDYVETVLSPKMVKEKKAESLPDKIILKEADMLKESDQEVQDVDMTEFAKLQEIEKQKEIQEEDARLAEIAEQQVAYRRAHKDKALKIKIANDKKLSEEKWQRFKDNQRYYFGWALTDNELVATRPSFKAIWVTDYNQTLDFGYQRRIKSNYWLGLLGAYHMQDYKLEKNPIYNWDGVTPNLLHLAVALDRKSYSRLGFGLDLIYSEQSFVISNGFDISLNKVAMYGARFRGMYKFYDSENYSSRLNLALEYPLVSSDELDPSGGPNFIIGADFSFQNWFKNHEVNVGLFYGLRTFENIQNDQTEDFIGLEIKFRNDRWL